MSHIICDKQESHTQQLSSIRHKTLFAKAISEQDQILCLMACIAAHAKAAGPYSGGVRRASKRVRERARE